MEEELQNSKSRHLSVLEEDLEIEVDKYDPEDLPVYKVAEPDPKSKIGMIYAQLPIDGSRVTCVDICNVLMEDANYNKPRRDRSKIFPAVFRNLENLAKPNRGLVRKHTDPDGNVFWSRVIEGGQTDIESLAATEDVLRKRYPPDSWEGMVLEQIEAHQFEWDALDIATNIRGGTSFDRPIILECSKEECEDAVENAIFELIEDGVIARHEKQGTYGILK